MADWSALPDVILATIFGNLSVLGRVEVRKVCSAWADACLRPEAWRCFSYTEGETSSSYLSDWDDTRKLQLSVCRGKELTALVVDVGKFFKTVNLCFRGKLSHDLLHAIAENCRNIKHLHIRKECFQKFSFVKRSDNSCNSAVKMIIQNNSRLNQLYLHDIDIPGHRAAQQKDSLPFGVVHSNSLTSLVLIQAYQQCNLSGLMYLVHLKELAIEPHLLSYSLLHHLAGNALKDLHIVAVTKHMELYNENLQNWQWKEIRQRNPNLRVHGHFAIGHQWVESEIILKEDMPVQSLKYVKYKLLDYESLTSLVCKYSETLVEFIDYSLSEESYSGGKMSRDLAVNNGILEIVNTCINLKTFAVKERVYSCVLVAILLKREDLNVLLLQDQVFLDELVPDLNLVGYSSTELETIRKSCTDLDALINMCKQLTGDQFNLYCHEELSEIMLLHYLKFR